jgi:hypothetical protein
MKSCTSMYDSRRTNRSASGAYGQLLLVPLGLIASFVCVNRSGLAVAGSERRTQLLHVSARVSCTRCVMASESIALDVRDCTVQLASGLAL